MDSLDRDCFILYGLGLVAGLTIGIVYALGRAGVISKPTVILFIHIYSGLTIATVIFGSIALSTLV